MLPSLNGSRKMARTSTTVTAKVIRHCWRLLPTVVSTLSKYWSRTERTLMRAPTTARPRWLLRKSAGTTKSPSIYRNLDCPGNRFAGNVGARFFPHAHALSGLYSFFRIETPSSCPCFRSPLGQENLHPYRPSRWPPDSLRYLQSFLPRPIGTNAVGAAARLLYAFEPDHHQQPA